MGAFSFFHWFPAILLLLVIVGGVYVLYRGLRRPVALDQGQSRRGTPEITEVPGSGGVTLTAGVDKIRWLAAAGYMLVVADCLFAQLMGVYQFYIFGWQVCLLTLLPLVVFYFVQRGSEQDVVVMHLHAALRLYGIYIAWSIVNGVLLYGVGADLMTLLLGIGISVVMFFVLIWLVVRCAQGIIAAFGIR